MLHAIAASMQLIDMAAVQIENDWTDMTQGRFVRRELQLQSEPVTLHTSSHSLIYRISHQLVGTAK